MVDGISERKLNHTKEGTQADGRVNAKTYIILTWYMTLPSKVMTEYMTFVRFKTSLTTKQQV